MSSEDQPVLAMDDRILEELARRGITQAVHFTTRRGLVGIFSTGLLQARQHLSTDDYLEHIYRPNAHIRREGKEYFRYVNLSLTQPNQRFFGISQGWHASEDDLFWAVLHLDARIAAHPGVLFAPGNMAYDGIHPKGGHVGLVDLFADPYNDGFGRRKRRAPGRASNLPSNPQAEVLYPDRIPTSYVDGVVVASEEDAASVHAIVGVVGHPEVEVIVDHGLLEA